MAKLRGSKNSILEFYISQLKIALEQETEEFKDFFIKAIINSMQNEIDSTSYIKKVNIKNINKLK